MHIQKTTQKTYFVNFIILSFSILWNQARCTNACYHQIFHGSNVENKSSEEGSKNAQVEENNWEEDQFLDAPTTQDEAV